MLCFTPAVGRLVVVAPLLLAAVVTQAQPAVYAQRQAQVDAQHERALQHWATTGAAHAKLRKAVLRNPAFSDRFARSLDRLVSAQAEVLYWNWMRTTVMLARLAVTMDKAGIDVESGQPIPSDCIAQARRTRALILRMAPALTQAAKQVAADGTALPAQVYTARNIVAAARALRVTELRITTRPEIASLYQRLERFQLLNAQASRLLQGRTRGGLEHYWLIRGGLK